MAAVKTNVPSEGQLEFARRAAGIQKTESPVSVKPSKKDEPSPGQLEFASLSRENAREYPDEEESGTWAKRTLAQVPLGIAQKFTWPLGILQSMIGAQAYEPYLEERAARAERGEPYNYDPKELMAASEQLSQYFPSQENIERGVESLTGLPLQPKTEMQKALRMASTAGAFRPGGIGERLTAAVVAPGVEKGLEYAGVPEAVAQPIGYAASAIAPTPSFSKVVKPSGLTTRQFEGLTKTTSISPERYSKITESVETEFKEIADKLAKESSLTYRAMKEDPNFKGNVSDLFDKVSSLAENVEGKVSARQLKEVFRSKINSREKIGISPDEFERTYLKESTKLYKELPKLDDLSPKQLVDQYRKNNRSLAEIFEVGRSKAFNRAKAEALMDYNKSLAEIIESKYPNTEFSDLFTFTNKRWSEIKDVEAVNSFIDNLFDGKIRYDKGKSFFSKNRIAEPFKKVYGEKNFNQFKGLMDDLMSSEQAYKHLKKARQSGFGRLAEGAASYFIHPSLAKVSGLKDITMSARDMLLDKPEIVIKWRSAIKYLKAGDFKKADKLVEEVKSATKSQKNQ